MFLVYVNIHPTAMAAILNDKFSTSGIFLTLHQGVKWAAK